MSDVPPQSAELRLADRRDFRLGDAWIRPSLRTAEGPAGAATAEPRIMQVLLVLADAGGAVVSREELLRRCWDGRIVGDDVVNRAIAEIRRLARETGSAFGVETIPRVGYRLSGVAQAIENEEGKAAPSAPASRRSWLLGGAAALAGAAGLGIWALRRPPADDGFAALVQAGEAHLQYGSPASLDRAVDLLDRAVALRHDDARAWGLLAIARQSVADLAPPATVAAAVASARAAIRTALELDPKEPNASVALVEIQGATLGWLRREEGLQAVLRRDPRNAFALGALVALYQASGLDGKSWDLNERLIAIDPLLPSPQFRRALKHWIYGRNAEALQAIRRVMELWPRHPSVWNAGFLILAFTGRPAAARAMLADERVRPESFKPLAIKSWNAALDALEKRSEPAIAAAREAFLEVGRTSPGLAAHGVMTLAGLGEVDAAYRIAEGLLLSKGPLLYRPPADSKRQMMNAPAWRYTQWLFTPPCASLRADGRFQPLCSGIGLTAFWQARGTRPDYLGRLG